MCFYPLSKNEKPKIAEKDIICWKKLRATEKGLRNPFMSAPDTFYLPGVLMPIIRLIKRTDKYDNAIIEKGYHSYKSEDICSWHWTRCSTHKFIIPQGSKYYEDRTEYVSSQIMMVK